MKPNILVCGKTGAGKTSLVQAVTSNQIVPDSAIGHGAATTRGFQCYQTPMANYIDAEGMEQGKDSIQDYLQFLQNEMMSRLFNDRADQLIHLIWYAIDGNGARITSADRQLIQAFGNKVILVLTKGDGIRAQQREALISETSKLVEDKQSGPIIVSTFDNGQGLARLIDLTQKRAELAMKGSEYELKGFRTAWEQFYQSKNEEWKAHMNEEAQSLVFWGAARAAAIAVVPIPMVDVVPLVANEGYMIFRIAAVYGYAIDQSFISMFLGMLGGSFAGKLFASWLPGAKVAIAYGVTFGVGRAAMEYFKSGMTLSPEEVKRIFLQNKDKKQP